MPGAFDRIVVIGSSCAGKSTLAKELSAALNSPYVELDALHWGPNWQCKPTARFQELVAEAAAQSRWVADGNYSIARDQLWPNATTVIWLNYSLPCVIYRALRRTLTRAVSRQVLWHGNRESFRRSFLSRESILWWVVSTFHRRQREFKALQADAQYGRLQWIEFKHPRAAERFLGEVRATI